MSFILDALKKSEAQRQRADAPALYEMKMAPPRQSVPTWLLVLGGLLIINIGVLTVVLLRGNHSAVPQSDAVTAPVAPPPAALSPAPVTGAAPAPAVISAAGAVTPPASGTLTAPASAAPNGAPGTNPADDAPAVEAAAPTPAPSPAATANSRGDVQTYDQAAGAPGANLPELKLDLHAYASNPADRFIYLNMVKLKEGDSSPAGVHVESITPDGAILSWHGSKFFLQRQ